MAGPAASDPRRLPRECQPQARLGRVGSARAADVKGRDEEDDIGHLIHRPGGSWGFTYDLAGDEGDEAGFKLSSHVFVPGEYISIRDDDGALHTFRVVTVEDV